jgi:hypothetical protein
MQEGGRRKRSRLLELSKVFYRFPFRREQAVPHSKGWCNLGRPPLECRFGRRNVGTSGAERVLSVRSTSHP